MAQRIATAGGAPAPDDADEAPPAVGLARQATALLGMGRSVALSLSLDAAILSRAWYQRSVFVQFSKLSLSHCWAL